jgi:hypothetical protein
MKTCDLLDAFSLSLSDKPIFREFETLEKEYGSTSIISLEDAVNFLRRVSHPTGAEQINDLGRLIRFVHWFAALYFQCVQGHNFEHNYDISQVRVQTTMKTYLS